MGESSVHYIESTFTCDRCEETVATRLRAEIAQYPRGWHKVSAFGYHNSKGEEIAKYQQVLHRLLCPRCFKLFQAWIAQS
jgi:hypothetical protein